MDTDGTNGLNPPGQPAVEVSAAGLIACIANDDLAGVRDQLDAGVNLEVRDEHGRTPIMVAALIGHRAIVDEFMRRGADLRARDAEGVPVDAYLGSIGAFSSEMRAKFRANLSSGIAGGLARARGVSKLTTGLGEPRPADLASPKAPGDDVEDTV